MRLEKPMHPFATRLAFCVALPFAVACSEEKGESEPDAGQPCTGTLEILWGHRESGSFTVFQDGNDAEITLGFQGFRYIDSLVKVSGVSATKVTLGFRIEVDGHAPYNQSADVSELEPGTDGALYARDVLVFFNDIPIGEIVNRNAKVTTQAKAAGCNASTARTVKLVDDQACVQLEDGGFECQDGGVN